MSNLTASQIIWDSIQTRLNNLTIANGYNFDIQQVYKRVPFGDFPNEELPFIEFYPVSDELVESKHRINYRQTDIEITVYYSQAPEDENLLDTAELIAADIQTVLNRSITSPAKTDPIDINLGKIVDKLILTSKSYEQTLNGQISWISTTLSYAIIYRTDYDNPYLLKNKI